MSTKDYLNTIKVGDTVYPCYDGKGGRATACKVMVVDGNKITVKGVFWGNDLETEATFINGKGWVKYNEEPTLMELLGVTDDEEDGDYYSLQDIPAYKDAFSDTYLQSLGLL